MAKRYKDYTRAMEPGNAHPKAPVVSVVGEGPDTYMWVGEADGPCYGSIGFAHSRELENLACAILRRIGWEIVREK